MPNIFDVAKYILTAVGGEISTMKLQKLCYYCQALSLACDGRPLFAEDFKHWDNGPVCEELFDKHRGLFYIDESIIKPEFCSGEELNSTAVKIISRALESYGTLDGAELSDLTHEEDPWLHTQKNSVMKKDFIREYYQGLISECHEKRKTA